GERAGIFDGLTADPAPARLLRGIVAIRGFAAQHPAGTEPVAECGVPRISALLGLLLCIEVIEVAKEFIEAVHGRQKFVSVAAGVVAKLAGRIAEGLEQFGNCRVSRL